MELTRWNPWRELEDVTSRLNTMFKTRDEGRGLGGMTAADWNPAVDIKENKEEYIITAELPGVDKKDIKVTLRNDVLAIEGARNVEQKSDDETLHRVERFYGTFFRSFVLPEGANDEKILANFKDGLLTVHVPKREPARPRTREVPVG